MSQKMERYATFGPPGMRTTLGRIWDEHLPIGIFIGANPGRADAHRDDATARKYVGFATRWGWGGYLAGNLYQWIATDMRELIGRVKEGSRVNPDEPDAWLHQLRLRDDLALTHDNRVVCYAWGNAPPSIRSEWERRERAVVARVKELGYRRVVAGRNGNGSPAHLSRLPYTNQPVEVT